MHHQCLHVVCVCGGGEGGLLFSCMQEGLHGDKAGGGGGGGGRGGWMSTFNSYAKVGMDPLLV